MVVKLFSNGCPKCKILKSKLDEKGLQYETSDNIQEVINLGFRTVPLLVVDDSIMDFNKAITWIQGM